VASGNEIRSVVQAGERFDRYPMGKIDQTYMWKVETLCNPTASSSLLTGNHPPYTCKLCISMQRPRIESTSKAAMLLICSFMQDHQGPMG
jgi:ketol-acid reductoisomerase